MGDFLAMGSVSLHTSTKFFHKQDEVGKISIKAFPNYSENFPVAKRSSEEGFDSASLTSHSDALPVSY